MAKRNQLDPRDAWLKPFLPVMEVENSRRGERGESELRMQDIVHMRALAIHAALEDTGECALSNEEGAIKFKTLKEASYNYPELVEDRSLALYALSVAPWHFSDLRDSPFREDREFIIKLAQEHPEYFARTIGKDIPKKFRGDREFMEAVIMATPRAYEDLSIELKNEQNRLGGPIIKRLLSTKSLTFDVRVLEIFGYDACFMARHDNEMFDLCVARGLYTADGRKYGFDRSLNHRIPGVIADKAEILRRAGLCLGALRFATNELQNDRDFVCELVRIDEENFYFAPMFHNDIEVAGLINDVTYIGDDLKNNKQYAIGKIRQNTDNFARFAPIIRNDADVVFMALQAIVKNNGNAGQIFSYTDFRKNREFILKCAQEIDSVLVWFGDPELYDGEFLLQALDICPIECLKDRKEACPFIFYGLFSKVKNRGDFFLEALRRGHGMMLAYADENLYQKPSFIRACLEISPDAMQYFPKSFDFVKQISGDVSNMVG